MHEEEDNSLIITEIEDQGQGIITTEDRLKGDLLLLEQDPLVYTVDDAMCTTHCHYCLRQLQEKKFVCKSCNFCLYCSPDCFKQDTSRVHGLECLALQRLTKRKGTVGFDKSHYTRTIRMTIRFLIQHASQNPFKLLESYSSFKSMDAADIQNMKQLSLLICQLLYIIHEKFSEKLDIDPNRIYDILCIFRTNSIGICDNDMNSVGIGLYRKCSKINHSCKPNSAVFFDKFSLSLKSLRYIQSNEQVTISYIELAQSTQSRREELMSTYGFLCNCERCCNGLDDEQLLLKKEKTYSPNFENQADNLYEEALRLENTSCALSTEKLLSAYQIYNQIFGEKHEKLVRVCSKICHNSVQLSNFDVTLKFALACVPCFEMCYPDLFLLLGVHYYMITKLYLYQANETEGFQYWKKAVNILKYWYNKEALKELEGMFHSRTYS